MYLSTVDLLANIHKSTKRAIASIYRHLSLFLLRLIKSSELARFGLSVAPWLAQTLAKNFHFNTLFSVFISILLTCCPLYLYQYYQDRNLDRLLSQYMPTKPQKLLNQLSSININDVNNMVVNFIFSYTTISSITNMLPSLASPMLIYPLFVFNICTAFLCTYTLQLHQLAKIQAIEQAHLNYISRLQTPQKSFPLVKAFIISLISLLCFIVIRDSRLLPYFLTKNILNTPFVSLNRLDGGFVILLGYYWMNLSNHPIATTLPTIFVHSKLLKLIHNITSSNTYSNYSNFISKVLVCHIGLSTTYISFKDNLKTSLKAHDLQLKAKQIAAQKLKTSSSDHKKPLLLIPCLGK